MTRITKILPAIIAALLLAVQAPAASALLISEVMYNPQGGDNNREWVEIFNDGPSAIDLASYSLGWGGDDYTFGTLQLSGVVASGASFVVGGTISDGRNGNPVFDQTIDFGPDLENPGFFFAPAAGIALFDLPVNAITATTIPIDAFVYAGALFGSNSRGLIDETGAVATIDFQSPFFSSGFSAERTADGFQAQNAPTPGTIDPSLVPEPSSGCLLGLGLAALGRRRSRTRTHGAP